MPLESQFLLSVTFVLHEEPDGTGGTARKPHATAFLVEVPDGRGAGGATYAVTAAHCVSDGAPSWLRVRREDGTTADREVEAWVMDPTEDVAICAFVPTDGDHWRAIPVSMLTPPQETVDRMRWGDRVYFVGLLTSVPDMGIQNTPMVRSGTLGALYVEGARIPRLSSSQEPRSALPLHLLDCRSYSGFSGSPCFLQPNDEIISPGGGTLALKTHTFLLGLISGHYPDPEQGADSHGGVGVVTPAERILDVLDNQELVSQL